MANSADPDQLTSELDLHCLQRQDVSKFSRTQVKTHCLINRSMTFSDKMTTIVKFHTQDKNFCNTYLTHTDISKQMYLHDACVCVNNKIAYNSFLSMARIVKL